MTHYREARERIQREDREQLRTDLGALMLTPQGRRVFSWLKAISGVFIEAPAEEPGRTAWIGHRALGLFILKAFQDAAPNQCHVADQELASKEALDQASLDEAARLDEEEAAKASPFEQINPQTKDTP